MPGFFVRVRSKRRCRSCYWNLALYGWHCASHTFDSLWRFYKVHHSGPTMATAFRLHIVEILLIGTVHRGDGGVCHLATIGIGHTTATRWECSIYPWGFL